MKGHMSLILVSIFTVSIVVGFLNVITISAQTTPSYISTRDHFDRIITGELKQQQQNNSTNYVLKGTIPGINSECTNELPIYIHGVWTRPNFVSFSFEPSDFFHIGFENALEIFDRADKSLKEENYPFDVVGFSWDSDTINPTNGWNIAKLIAKNNGPKLGQAILDIKKNCEQMDIRLIAHSLGARVALSALNYLSQNQDWNNNNFRITSVHLMGAAVDNEEVSKDPNDILTDSTNFDIDKIKSAFGEAIESEVVKFYNLFNPEDDILGPTKTLMPIIYTANEKDSALGKNGKQNGIDLPTNYNETNVSNKISKIRDADGDGFVDFGWYFIPLSTLKFGDNHFGYVGFRDFIFGFPGRGPLDNSGAMSVVVEDWKKVEN
jgi:hypothetical protein